MCLRRVFPLTALLAGTTMLLSACGEGGTRSEGTAGRPTATPTRTAAPEGIDAMAGASTKPMVVGATNDRTALLTRVRVARHEGFDRVVFAFANALPGYDVRYVRRPIRQDGSGKVVKVAGSFVARVRMENALDADLSKSSAPLTYLGPMRFSPSTPEVAELARSPTAPSSSRTCRRPSRSPAGSSVTEV